MTGNIIPHKFANYLRGGSIFDPTDRYKVSAELCFHSYFESDVFFSDGGSVPNGYTFGYPFFALRDRVLGPMALT